MTWELKLIDAMKGLAELPDGSVNLIILDPPYESLEKHRAVGTTTRLKKSKQSSNEWFPTVPYSYFDEFFKECYRVLARNSFLFVMSDEETSDLIKPKVKDAKFELRKSLIWNKVGKMKEIACPNCGTVVCEKRSPGTPGMSYPFRSCYEMILFAQKGHRKKPEDKSVRNVLEIPWIKHKGAYPTEKPVELCEIIIKQSSYEGDLVLDTFAGSGSCGEAAFNLGRNFLGFDVTKKALRHWNERRQGWDWEGKEGRPEPQDDGGLLEFLR